MTVPATLWFLYAVPAYVVGPALFRLRRGRWPMARVFPPRTPYALVDSALAMALLAYSAWAALAYRRQEPAAAWTEDPWLAAGVGASVLGAGLRAWAIAALGPSWRIGQDEADPVARHVRRGPYRLMHHPINTGLVLVAVGQAAMTRLHPAALALLGVAVVYFAVQGRAEERRWRRSGVPGAPDGPGPRQ